MEVVPLNIKDAVEFVKRYHRHSIAGAGKGKFAIGAHVDGKLVGVALAGRPVSRMLDNGFTLEILRVCTDGTPNANSFLYGRVKKIGQLMGYKKIITYTLQEESGSSLKAVGARPEHTLKGHEWSRPSRERQSQPVYKKDKVRWSLCTDMRQVL